MKEKNVQKERFAIKRRSGEKAERGGTQVREEGLLSYNSSEGTKERRKRSPKEYSGG